MCKIWIFYAGMNTNFECFNNVDGTVVQYSRCISKHQMSPEPLEIVNHTVEQFLCSEAFMKFFKFQGMPYSTWQFLWNQSAKHTVCLIFGVWFHMQRPPYGPVSVIDFFGQRIIHSSYGPPAPCHTPTNTRNQKNSMSIATIFYFRVVGCCGYKVL